MAVRSPGSRTAPPVPAHDESPVAREPIGQARPPTAGGPGVPIRSPMSAWVRRVVQRGGCGVPIRSPMSAWVRRAVQRGGCGVPIRSSMSAWVRHIGRGGTGRGTGRVSRADGERGAMGPGLLRPADGRDQAASDGCRTPSGSAAGPACCPRPDPGSAHCTDATLRRRPCAHRPGIHRAGIHRAGPPTDGWRTRRTHPVTHVRLGTPHRQTGNGTGNGAGNGAGNGPGEPDRRRAQRR